MVKNRGWLIAALLAPLAGCATNQPAPLAQVGAAEAAIERAAEVNAAQYAPVALREARQKLDLARGALDRGQLARARFLAREAEASAELALAQADTLITEELATAALEGVETLRSELNRKEGTL